MNVILPIAIYAALGLAGLGILGMGISGLRSLTYGKVRPLSIGVIAIPIVLVLVLGFSMETWAQAGIFTLVVMFGLALLGMLLTGIRNVFR
jgi:FtsH-binding integral membrane protein